MCMVLIGTGSIFCIQTVATLHSRVQMVPSANGDEVFGHILWLLPPPLPRCSLSLRCKNCVVDASQGAGRPGSVALCILINCGFLWWSLSASKKSFDEEQKPLLCEYEHKCYKAIRNYVGLVDGGGRFSSKIHDHISPRWLGFPYQAWLLSWWVSLKFN